jgi:hypothetical protein
MSKLNTPTIERTHPERARQISDSTGRGDDWIRTPATAGATFALVMLAMLVLVLATVVGTVRP